MPVQGEIRAQKRIAQSTSQREGERVTRPYNQVNFAASSKRPREREKEVPGPGKLGEDQGRCIELGTASKNL